MASTKEVKCPECGGRATFCYDDGVTYCDEKDCKKFDAYNPNYVPPMRRGGS